jgi:hypothetical protein|tara:strand:- start:2340 stop:2528 length:189 start_codon:yes stop_codon:yes gene_type:complete
MVTKFDEAINNALAKKIERAKKKISRQIKRVTPPNTPGNRPVSQGSPALAKSIGSDIAEGPV